MMANENLEDWSHFGWAEVQAVRATIVAYAVGEIQLPEVPATVSKLRYVDRKTLVLSPPVTWKAFKALEGTQHAESLPLTPLTVAKFLGWTRKRMDKPGKEIQPDYRTIVSFQVIDAMRDGLVLPADIQDLRREQMSTVIAGMRQIREADEANAKESLKAVEEARYLDTKTHPRP
jgi:hypothetical protein